MQPCFKYLQDQVRTYNNNRMLQLKRKETRTHVKCSSRVQSILAGCQCHDCSVCGWNSNATEPCGLARYWGISWLFSPCVLFCIIGQVYTQEKKIVIGSKEVQISLWLGHQNWRRSCKIRGGSRLLDGSYWRIGGMTTRTSFASVFRLTVVFGWWCVKTLDLLWLCCSLGGRFSFVPWHVSWCRERVAGFPTVFFTSCCLLSFPISSGCL